MKNIKSVAAIDMSILDDLIDQLDKKRISKFKPQEDEAEDEDDDEAEQEKELGAKVSLTDSLEDNESEDDNKLQKLLEMYKSIKD